MTITPEQLGNLSYDILPVKGLVFSQVVQLGDELYFKLAPDVFLESEYDKRRTFVIYHGQDCCEHVVIEQIDGDLNDLVGVPLQMAEKATKRDDMDDCGAWTFYKFATIKGYVTVRWYGYSNGYYSISVDEEWRDEYGSCVY